MGTVVAIIAVIIGIAGIIGSVAPALPGPPLSWLGILIVYLRGGTNGAGDPMSMKLLLIWLGVTTLVTVIDYIVPAWFTKFTGGTKYAGLGAIAGLFIGMIFPPVGIIVGSLLGAFIAELLFGGKGVVNSVSSSIGAFLGFIFGTGLKLIASGLMLYQIIVYI